MCKQLSRLAIICFLVTMVSCSRNPASIDPRALIGLSEEQIINKLGKPDINHSRTPSHTELLYRDTHLRVFMEDALTTGCRIGNGSPISLNAQIRCGVSIEEVQRVYGFYESEIEVTEDVQPSQYTKGILYHTWLTRDSERYFLAYPSQQLLFTFYPDKTLKSVWIGKTY
jgi:hypothetical protein